MGCSLQSHEKRHVVQGLWLAHSGRQMARSHRLPGMTSTANARELDRLRTARSGAQEKFARQMKMLEQIEATAGDLEKVTSRWQVQLAALAELSGSTAAAAELSGLPKADIEAATRSVDKAAVDAAVAAAKQPERRRRKPEPAIAAGAASRVAAATG